MNFLLIALFKLLRRFIGRRGHPKPICNDNGTNFVNAEIEIKKALRQSKQQKITNNFNENNIAWYLNPQSIPWITKKCLKAALKDRIVTKETKSLQLLSGNRKYRK